MNKAVIDMFKSNNENYYKKTKHFFHCLHSHPMLDMNNLIIKNSKSGVRQMP